MHQSERLRRDVTCEHAALQQRAASAAPLHQAACVCLLIHVGVAQASTRMLQERPVRPFVSTVEQVRVGCCRRRMSCPLTQSSLFVNHKRRILDQLESVQRREGPRRDGACKHAVLHQRTACEAPLHEPAHVCVLMHVGAAQARTPMRQERPVRALVLAAVQVRVGCRRRGM